MTDITDSSTDPLASLAKGVWWWVLLRGIFAIAFGIIALIAPGAALTAVALVYGAYALVDGIFAIVHAVQVRNSSPRWGWLLLSGILSALAGLAALILPALAGFFGGLFVLWVIVFWSFMIGVAGIQSASGAQAGRGKTFGIIAGVVSILFAVILTVLLFINPGETVLSLIWVVGIYAIIFGVMLIAAAIAVRGAGRKLVTGV
jgi:uncharacterized membrane protein HdeD (DUF308 family)